MIIKDKKYNTKANTDLKASNASALLQFTV